MKWFKDFWNERKGFYHDPLQRIIVRGLKITAALLVIVVIVSLFISCQTVKYVPVETVRTEYIHSTDTVKEIDSVFSEKETIIKEADSATIAKLGLQLKDNERAILILQKELEKQISNKSESKTDTVIKTDSIQVPYPVEKPLTKWQQLCIDYGKITLGATILLIILAVIWVYKKIRSKVI